MPCEERAKMCHRRKYVKNILDLKVDDTLSLKLRMAYTSFSLEGRDLHNKFFTHRMRIYASHTFCHGCQGNRHGRLGEEREMDVQAAEGGTFDWEGHQNDQQPIVISEPGDWAPDAPEAGSWATMYE